MKKIDCIIKEILEGMKVANVRISKTVMNNQYVIGCKRAFTYNTNIKKNRVVQIPSFGIEYRTESVIDEMASICKPFSVVAWMYYAIRNRSMTPICRGTYSFTIALDIDMMCEYLGLTQRSAYRYIAECVEMGYIFNEGKGEYSLTPMCCPWPNLHKVLEWNEEEIYFRTRNEPGGLKTRRMARNSINVRDYDIPLLTEYNRMKKVDYSPSTMDIILDYIRVSAENATVFPMSANIIVDHAASYGAKMPRSTVARSLASFMKTGVVKKVGTKDRRPLFTLADQMPPNPSERTMAMRDELELSQYR